MPLNLTHFGTVYHHFNPPLQLAENLQAKDRLSYKDIEELIGPMKYKKHLHHAEFAADM